MFHYHVVFSDVSFCSPTTLCVFASLGSNYAVHTASVMKLFPAIQNTTPRVLSYTFEYDDDGDNGSLVEVNKLPTSRNGTVDKVIELMMQ